MKKKFLFLTLLLGILGLVSCVGGGNESSSSSTTHELSTSTSTPSTGTSINKPTSTHIHNYSEEWNNDATNHWHECSCGEKEAQAEHTYGEFVVTKEATHAEDGSKKQECSVCVVH